MRANILNQTNLGIKVIHERNTHNFPLDLALKEYAFLIILKPVGAIAVKVIIVTILN